MEAQTHSRIRENTRRSIQSAIDAQIQESIRFYATQSKAAISDRIDELDREWDIERVIEANASSLAIGSLLMGLTVNKKWFLMTGTVLGFLLQHSTQGWCPPVPVLRKLGVRTRKEIDREKYALKALRGDFDHIAEKTETNQLLRAHDALLASSL